MANPHKGEIELKAGDSTYILRYSIDAICSLEDEMDKGFPAIAAEMGNPHTMRVSSVRKVLLAGLRDHHPDMTLKQAGELMLAAGGAVVVLGKVAEAFAAAFPDAEAEGKKSPPQRANSRGAGSPS